MTHNTGRPEEPASSPGTSEPGPDGAEAIAARYLDLWRRHWAAVTTVPPAEPGKGPGR